MAWLLARCQLVIGAAAVEREKPILKIEQKLQRLLFFQFSATAAKWSGAGRRLPVRIARSNGG
jgi:hypothetical protein